MNAFEAFTLFTALKMHFNSKSYCYFKYNGKIKITQDSFNKRNDKINFYRLAKKKDVKELIISNLLINSNIWVTELLLPEAENNLKKWQQINQSLLYTFKQNISNLSNDLEELLMVKDQYPKLLVAMLQKTITMETVIILNRLINFLPIWHKQIKENVIWPEINQKLNKYDVFITIDKHIYKNIALDHFSS